MKKFLLNSKPIAILVAILLTLTTSVFAVPKVSTGTGPWNTAGTWSPSGVPAAGDAVTIAAGHVVTIDITTNNLLSLTVNGTLTFGNSTTARTLNVAGAVSVAATGVINVANFTVTHSFVIGGNLANAGSIDLTLDANSLCNLTFNGAANQTISGAGTTTDLNGITINNTGVANNNIVEVTSSAFTVPAGFLTITNGIFKLSGSFALTNTFFPAAAYIIPATGGIWLNNATAVVTSQNGDVTLNGSMRISAGTYNLGNAAGNDLRYDDGSSLTIDGGSLIVAGALSGVTSVPTEALIFNMSAGTFTVSTNADGNNSNNRSSFDLRIPGSSFTMSGGTIIIEGANSGSAGDYRNLAATVNITGGTIQFGSAATGTGNDNFVLVGTGPYLFPSVSIVDNATSVPTVTNATGGMTVTGNITIATGTSLLGNGQPISLTGNWSNGGTFTSGTQTTTFNGSAAQTIGGASTTAFSSLTINNAAGVSLTASETVNATLTLTAGILSIQTGNTLTIPNGNTIGGGTFSATKRIATLVNTGTGAQGFLRVNNIASNSSYIFPVGDAANFLPDTLVLSAATTTANNSFTVCAFQGITTNGTPNGTAFSPAQKTKVVDAVWTINYNGPGSPAQSPGTTTIKLGWPAGLEGSSFALNPNALIGIAHYTGAPTNAWGTSVGSGDNASNSAIRTGVTSFSPFAVGTIDPGGAPLAIQVGYFNASKGNTVNTLNWSAACNSAQATFEIERSADGRNFTTINSITASQARCASPFTYDDASPLAGVNFYRIKIIDVDGRVSYTATVKVGAQQKDMVLVAVLPNPVSNIAQLNITTSKKDKVELAVVSLEGKVVYNTTVSLQSGSSIVSIDATNFAKGAYIIRGVFADGQASSVKFVKQ